MKGVVRPQAMPTRRKPSVQLRMEGEEGWEGVSGEEEDMVEGMGEACGVERERSVEEVWLKVGVAAW